MAPSSNGRARHWAVAPPSTTDELSAGQEAEDVSVDDDFVVRAPFDNDNDGTSGFDASDDDASDDDES